MSEAEASCRLDGETMPADPVQHYTGNKHLLGAGMHLAVGNPSLEIVYRDKRWLFEWHYYSGPSVLSRRTHDPLDKQPGENSMFWKVAVWWKDQGCQVVDGVAQWDEPPIVESRFRRINKSNLWPDENGDVVMTTNPE